MGKVIGLIYNWDENWVAGSYYVENLILALSVLPQEKPFLKIYTEKEEVYRQLKLKTNYPLMSWVELTDHNTILDKLVNKFSYLIFGKYWIVRGIDTNVDLIFPATPSYFFHKFKHQLYWIPDFQEIHYPGFFSTTELLKRKKFITSLVNAKMPIVFSSQSVLKDFTQCYPKARNLIFVMPFAVTLPVLSGIKIEDLRKKFNIEGEYFICSNQFWTHKNHSVVLRALLELTLREYNVNVIFTGNPFNNRNPDYINELLAYVAKHNLTGRAKFLGFISRQEQLVLMKNSIAVIQPSLFEGWSTVVEDAKALSVPIVVSNIPVHHEQVDGLFFNKEDHLDLADKMIEIRNDSTRSNKQSFYQSSVLQFGNRFIEIINAIS